MSPLAEAIRPSELLGWCIILLFHRLAMPSGTVDNQRRQIPFGVGLLVYNFDKNPVLVLKTSTIYVYYLSIYRSWFAHVNYWQSPLPIITGDLLVIIRPLSEVQ
jgi:hypothetical protein